MMACAKAVTELIKPWVEIAAYLAALLFFTYKVYSGYFVVDMSIGLDCERKRSPGSENKDYLGIRVTLKKGERGGVELHDALVRVTSCIGNQVFGPLPLVTIARLNRTNPTQDAAGSTGVLRSRIDWTQIPKDSPRLNMPPGDESKLAAFVEVDTGVPYMVEVVILARKLLLRKIKTRFSQWRAAKVSLPL
jgi:hypothetical protein